MPVNNWEMFYWISSPLILMVTVFYVWYAPIKAIKIGRQLDTNQNRHNAKERLFLTLFAYRGSPLNYQFVDGLNQIDVVYRDNPNVLLAWHNHYRSLHVDGQTDAVRTWEIERMEMLSQMSIALGYGALNVSELLQNYYPVGHENDYKNDVDTKQALNTFLKSSTAMNAMIIERMERQDNSDNEAKT